MPEPRERLGIRVDNQIYRWREGEVVIFDDAYEHGASALRSLQTLLPRAKGAASTSTAWLRSVVQLSATQRGLCLLKVSAES